MRPDGDLAQRHTHTRSAASLPLLCDIIYQFGFRIVKEAAPHVSVQSVALPPSGPIVDLMVQYIFFSRKRWEKHIWVVIILQIVLNKDEGEGSASWQVS